MSFYCIAIFCSYEIFEFYILHIDLYQISLSNLSNYQIQHHPDKHLSYNSAFVTVFKCRVYHVIKIVKK